jgi:hypothetical protein
MELDRPRKQACFAYQFHSASDWIRAASAFVVSLLNTPFFAAQNAPVTLHYISVI